MHPLVQAQRFARSEFERGLAGLTDEEARFRPAKADGSQMNCISWVICHLAHQEWLFFVNATGGPENPRLVPFATGAPAVQPPLGEALDIWRESTTRADEWLSKVSDEGLAAHMAPAWFENYGTALMRNTFHYWFHSGEINAIRQLLGHPEIIFVGNMLEQMEYAPPQQ